jgi:dTDP-4-dehydrorhamnose reductase
MIVKIAVFGASGLLGSAVCRSIIRRGYSLLAYSNKERVTFSDQYRTKQMPFSDDNQLTRELFDQWPSAVINCAAISSPDTVDKSPELARLINVEGATRLASISAHIGARFIHISTDMVFDGKKSPYRSTDQPNPLSEYGRQKLDAEKKILSVTDENLVVLRVTLLNGNSPLGRRSQHEKILRALASGSTLTLFEDELRQPCSAENLSDIIVELTERPNLNGLYHWAGSEEVSRYELGVRILERFGINPDNILRGSIENDEGKGQRPQHVSFILEPLASKVRTQPLSIDEQLAELQVPTDLYSWYREFADNPNCYIPRF